MTLRRFIHVTLITSALCAVSLQAGADAFDDGMAAYQASKYDEAVVQWKPIAERGHAQAAYNLGFMHEFGYGVTANDNESFKWYLRAAQEGHTQAQRSVVWMYERGKGIKQDRAQATRWVELSGRRIEHDGAADTDVVMQQHFLDALMAQMQQAAARYDAQHKNNASLPQELDASNQTS